MKSTVLIFWLCLAGLAAGQAPEPPPPAEKPAAKAKAVRKAAQPAAAIINAPSSVEPGDLVILDGSASVGTAFKWRLVGSSKTFLPVENNTKAVFASGVPGPYSFVLAVADVEGTEATVDVATHTLVVTGKAPQPPPGPTPDPPPGPGPNPPTPPGPTPGQLSVLFVQETSLRHKLPFSQREVLDSTAVRDYLDRVCKKNAAGLPQWRFWDGNVNVLYADPQWKKIASLPRLTPTDADPTPWLYVVAHNEAAIDKWQVAYSGPVPKDVPGTLALLKKYGGE